MTDSGLLTGKVILITGASRGIGAAAARLFAREGAAVVLTARGERELGDLVDELTGQGHEAVHVAGDVTVPGDAARAVSAALDRYGRLDAAFNNAGRGGGPDALHLISATTFDQVVAVNARGTWHFMREEIGAMLPRGGGSIVNNASVAGLLAGPVSAAYVAAKHAVVGLTKAGAAEYGARGIRINAVATGVARTPMSEAWMAVSPGVEPSLAQTAPLARMAGAEEIAEAAAWLCSDRASYITGATLTVDGGLSSCVLQQARV
ncbi:glucose 1-dehydrogenase [Nonomuraea fuscirosea]|uniref:SDR family NAD(P)-dependent oxidoreductase n=1 Tax=Nonomuraea fuscirosea TaxID=1291556 RepID=UPI002DD88A41|nr:glucose 1-dehydrogenase [Nonomuraea fuscirosea]WSA55907.1 glucose 1-dehydrogenase [Nonomuraea fuscirosea]